MTEAAERTGNDFLKSNVPIAHIVFKRDFKSARVAWEGFMTGPEGEWKRINPEENLNWMELIFFAFALQRTGEEDSAHILIGDLATLLEKHISEGVVWHWNFGAQFLASLLDAISGRNHEAIEHLLEGLSQKVANHTGFVQRWSLFDGLRGDPEFEALVEEGQARLEAERQRLADEGLLLTPKEVMALEDFRFNPFVEQGSE